MTTGDGASRGWSSRLASSRLMERIDAVSDLRARRIAALALLAALVLALIAQWKPWFRIDALTTDFGGGGDRQARTIDAINALYALVIPYYVGWMLIAMAGGAAVFGRKKVRRTAAGVAAGALAGQVLVVLATWHDDGVGVYRGLTPGDSALHGTREAGIYLAIAAVVVSAAALVIAVRGRIVPMADEDEAAIPVAAPVEESHAPSPRMGVRAGTPWVDGGEELDDSPSHGSIHMNGHQPQDAPVPAPPQSDAPDHAMYMRPRDAKVNS